MTFNTVSIIANDPIELTGYIMGPAVGLLFSASGPYKLMNAVNEYHNQSQFDFSQINSLIQNSIINLSDQDSFYLYGKAIADALNAGDDLAENLALDFAFVNNGAGYQQDKLKSQINNCVINEDNAAMFAYQFYQCSVYYSSIPPVTAIKPVFPLLDSIKSYMQTYSLSQLKTIATNNINSLTSPSRSLDLVETFTDALGISVNQTLLYQLDINYDAPNIEDPGELNLDLFKIFIGGLNYVDEYTLASSFFAKVGWIFQSTSGYDLLAAINEYLVPVTERPTITSALGNYTISPTKDLYLNYCTKEGENYLVGGSIFNGFDMARKGPKLSEMIGIDTIFGRISAIAQCGTAKTMLSYQDIYLTLSAPGGTFGDARETGCTPVVDAATLGGYCNSVFYHNLLS